MLRVATAARRPAISEKQPLKLNAKKGSELRAYPKDRKDQVRIDGASTTHDTLQQIIRASIMRQVYFLFFPLLLASCEVSENPRNSYDGYVSRVVSGLPFDEGLNYFSKRKTEQIEAALLDTMERMDKTREDAIGLYSSVSQRIQACVALSFVEETTIGQKSTLVYTQKDTCSSDAKMADLRIVSLVYEDGWKIDEIDMTFSDSETAPPN